MNNNAWKLFFRLFIVLTCMYDIKRMEQRKIKMLEKQHNFASKIPYMFFLLYAQKHILCDLFKIAHSLE